MNERFHIYDQFLDPMFRPPTCHDLELTIGELAHCDFREDTIYQGNVPVAIVEHGKKIHLNGNRLLKQTILERTSRTFHTKNRGKVQVHNAIFHFEGSWYALAPSESGAWIARRKMTLPPPNKVQEFLFAAIKSQMESRTEKNMSTK